MLVLTRRVGEAIRIGDAVRLVVVAVRGQQVQLGIEAPDGVPLWRGEIYERIVRDGDPSKRDPR